MTDGERRYAVAASVHYAEKIAHNADVHHVSRRMEALACLSAAITVLYAVGCDDFDVANAVAQAAPERAQS